MTVAHIASGRGSVPEFDQGDRLWKVRKDMGLSREEFAELIGVSRQTITNAELGAHEVRRITLNAWAYASGADLHWLEFGHPSPEEVGSPCELCGIRDSNPEPADIRQTVSDLRVLRVAAA